jgi:hypothetical protein
VRRGDFSGFLLHVPLGVNRPDQRVANESGDEEGGENVKYQIADIIARNALGHACVMQVIDEHRPGNPRRRPRGKQTAMDRADESRTEQIRELGRHGSKSAAIHRGDDAKRARENRDGVYIRERRRDGVTNHAEHEEDKI